MTRLAIVGARKRYGGVTALADCSFAIDRSGIYGLIGPNGAGKTTLFDAVCGDITLDGGRILLDDADVTGFAPHRLATRGVARSFQECRVLPEATCRDNLCFAMQRKGLAATLRQAVTRGVDARARVEADRFLHLVNLTPYADAPASVLSFGQRRLLEIACTLVTRPRILLLDEPAAGVNPALLDTLSAAIERQHQESPGVMLIVEHNMEFIMRLAGEIIVMHQGSVLERGTPGQVQASARVAEAYLG